MGERGGGHGGGEEGMKMLPTDSKSVRSPQKGIDSGFSSFG